MIRIRKPTEQIAECYWLPRFIDKTRLWHSRELSFFYRLAFCSPLGLDGKFLRFFQLSKKDFFKAVHDSGNLDDGVSKWFLDQETVTSERIAAWNVLASHVGAKGYPGYWIFHILKWILYPKAVARPVNSVFEAIIQDEE